MALYATNRFAGDGTTTQYEINFVGQYIDRSHVKAYRVDNATQVRTPVVIAPGQWLNATTITGFAPTPVGQTLVIYRDTQKPPMVDFVNGSRFTEYNLDLVARQGLFVAMEALDSNDHEAIDELLAAIEVVVGLVNQATAAVDDATAAALAAAGSAAAALGYRNAAQAAQTAAETARNSALAYAGYAATSATNAGDSATAAASSASAAATSASNAAASASTATTQASNAAASAATANTKANAANTSATNAAASATNAGNSATAAANSASAASTSAGNAATSATNAANSASAAAASAASALGALASAGSMQCRVVVVNAASRIVRLERCGGQVITLGGVVRTLPSAGIQLTLTSTPTPQHLYAGWNGSAVVFIESATAPVFNTTLAQWVSPTDNSYAAVAYVRPDSLATPDQFLRNYYNGPGMASGTASLGADYTANWDGTWRQITTLSMLFLPGDTVNAHGFANVMSTPGGRAGDLVIKLSSTNLGRARHVFPADPYIWHNYCCMANTIQRAVLDSPTLAIFELWYFPISATGDVWTMQGDSISTKLIVNITPYKWA